VQVRDEEAGLAGGPLVVEDDGFAEDAGGAGGLEVGVFEVVGEEEVGHLDVVFHFL